jgi:hypothetical protein
MEARRAPRYQVCAYVPWRTEMIDLAPLGVYGVTVGILLWIVTQLWTDNRKLREQMRQDQQAFLPALTASTEALKAVLEEGIRARAIADRERQ